MNWGSAEIHRKSVQYWVPFQTGSVPVFLTVYWIAPLARREHIGFDRFDDHLDHFQIGRDGIDVDRNDKTIVILANFANAIAAIGDDD